jgi:thioesterase domain-containing protein
LQAVAAVAELLQQGKQVVVVVLVDTAQVLELRVEVPRPKAFLELILELATQLPWVQVELVGLAQTEAQTVSTQLLHQSIP